MAIEDGFILARALSELPGDIPSRLSRYENARRERTRRTVEGSAENIRRFHNPVLADPAKAREYVDREWAGQNVASRYQWLFRYDVTTAAI
jgi:salicylate hydroxylase